MSKSKYVPVNAVEEVPVLPSLAPIKWEDVFEYLKGFRSTSTIPNMPTILLDAIRTTVHRTNAKYSLFIQLQMMFSE